MYEIEEEFEQYKYYRDKAIESLSITSHEIFEVMVKEKSGDIYHVLKVFRNKEEVTDEFRFKFKKLGYICIYGKRFNVKNTGERFSVIKNKNTLLQKSIISEINKNIFKVIEPDYKSYAVEFRNYNFVELYLMQDYLFQLIEEELLVKLTDQDAIEYIENIKNLKMYIYINSPKVRLTEFLKGFIFRDIEFKKKPTEFFNEFTKLVINDSLKDRKFTVKFLKEIIKRSHDNYIGFDSEKLDKLLLSLQKEEKEEEHSVDRRKKKLKM